MDLTERFKIDFYSDRKGNIVFTEKYHIKRGVCCGLGCRHCPFAPKHQAGNKKISAELETYAKATY